MEGLQDCSILVESRTLPSTISIGISFFHQDADSNQHGLWHSFDWVRHTVPFGNIYHQGIIVEIFGFCYLHFVIGFLQIAKFAKHTKIANVTVNIWHGRPMSMPSIKWLVGFCRLFHVNGTQTCIIIFLLGSTFVAVLNSSVEKRYFYISLSSFLLHRFSSTDIPYSKHSLIGTPKYLSRESVNPRKAPFLCSKAFWAGTQPFLKVLIPSADASFCRDSKWFSNALVYRESCAEIIGICRIFPFKNKSSRKHPSPSAHFAYADAPEISTSSTCSWSHLPASSTQ